MIANTADALIVISKQEAEIAQLHRTIAKQAAYHKEEMKKKIGRIQSQVDRLLIEIEDYEQIITMHTNLGGK